MRTSPAKVVAAATAFERIRSAVFAGRPRVRSHGSVTAGVGLAQVFAPASEMASATD